MEIVELSAKHEAHMDLILTGMGVASLLQHFTQ